MHTPTHTYNIYVCTHMYIHTSMHVHAHIHTHRVRMRKCRLNLSHILPSVLFQILPLLHTLHAHTHTHIHMYTCTYTHKHARACTHTHTHTESNSMVLSFILRFTEQEFNSQLKIHVQLDLNTGYINMATNIQSNLLFRNKLCITNGIIQ